MKNIIYKLLIIFQIFLISCEFSDYESKSVDFSKKINNAALENETNQYLEVVVGAMISPKETFSLYKDLFEYISDKLNITLRLEQRKTYSEANELISKKQVKVGFICSGAYIKIKNECDLLVVPVFNNQPYYQAYIIVNNTSSINNIKELKGKSFAFTDFLSNTGKMYPEKRIKELFNMDSHDFFSKTTYSNSHDASIQLISKGLVDGASIDGLIYEFMLKNSPEKVRNIKIIEKSDFFGSPPIVTSRHISKTLKFKLKNVLLYMHKDSLGKKILKKLMIDRFTIPNDSIYNNLTLYYNNVDNDTL